jgi:hypothetical protein
MAPEEELVDFGDDRQIGQDSEQEHMDEDKSVGYPTGYVHNTTPPTAVVGNTQMDVSSSVPQHDVSTAKKPVVVCESVLINGELTSDLAVEKQHPTGLGDLRPRTLSAEELHVEAQRVLSEKPFWDAHKKMRWDEKKRNRRMLKEQMGKKIVLDKLLNTSRHEPDAKGQSKDTACVDVISICPTRCDGKKGCGTCCHTN